MEMSVPMIVRHCCHPTLELFSKVDEMDPTTFTPSERIVACSRGLRHNFAEEGRRPWWSKRDFGLGKATGYQAPINRTL